VKEILKRHGGEINSLTKTCESSLLCPEGAALFERPPPHFSTAVYILDWRA
jgi:hypothetical protein